MRTTLFAWAGWLHLAPFCHKRYTTTTTTSTRYKRFRKFISFTPIGLAAYSHIRNISKIVIEAAILVEVKLLSMTGHLDYSVKKVPRKNRHNCCYRLCCVWPSQVAHSVSLFILGLVLLILVGAWANFFLLTAWLESTPARHTFYLNHCRCSLDLHLEHIRASTVCGAGMYHHLITPAWLETHQGYTLLSWQAILCYIGQCVL